MLVFNGAATTEIHTSGPTLPAHGALPTCAAGAGAATQLLAQLALVAVVLGLTVGGGASVGAAAVAGLVTLAVFEAVGSEGHTSEIQALVRLANAVFCWETKTG